jgi:AcrR family transcriptional regulator
MTAADSGRTKQELSAAILQTAHHLFNVHGVECVSMHQIAKSAGIGQGTLYRRYANKGDLCMDVMKDSFERFSEDIEQQLKAMGDRTVQDRLYNVVCNVIQFLETKSRFLGVMHASQLNDVQKTDFFESPPYHFIHGAICSLLKEAAEHELAYSIDPSYVAHSYISVMSPHTHMHLRTRCGYSLAEVQEQFRLTHIAPLFK